MSSSNRKIVGLIPGSSSPHVEVSLGKILNPKFLPKAVPSVCVCVNECMNVCVNGVNGM